MAIKRKNPSKNDNADGMVEIVKNDHESVLTENNVYTDTLMQLGLGPYVSRVTFGMQVGPNQISPNLQLIMPSNALLDFAKHVVDMFSQESVIRKMEASHSKLQRDVSSKLLPGRRK